MNIYRITPQEKKSIEILYEVFEEKNDTVRGYSIRELYRWGVGYRREDDAPSAWELNNNGIFCDPDVGHGFELDDLISVDIEFDEGFTEEEQLEIEHNWGEGGAGWLYDGDHNWEVEDVSLLISGPVVVDLIDEDTNEVIVADYKPTTEVSNLSWQTVSDQEATVWPFPIQSNFGETDKTN